MFNTPPEFQSAISSFPTVFSTPTWKKAKILLFSALCCPGSRTICNLLRTAGKRKEKNYHKYHRFLSRDKWKSLSLSKILLKNLIAAFIPKHQALVLVLDETIERRWGSKIKKRGIYRDAVRSSASHFVKCSGLRWMSMMLLTPLPWLKKGTWALPVLTALCPSERYTAHSNKLRKHKSIIDWARQMMIWLSRQTRDLNKKVYLVGDGSYATYELMSTSVELKIGLIARMRMDARLFDFRSPSTNLKRGPKPKLGQRIESMTQRLSNSDTKWTTVEFTQWYGNRNKKMEITSGKAIWSRNKNQFAPLHWVLVRDPQKKLDPVLMACSDLDTAAIDIVRFFVQRWRVEVSFAEVRRHLGVETQRQWSDLAIERTTPLLMGLKSVSCLMALDLHKQGKLKISKTAWYKKVHFSYSDILHAVRMHTWDSCELPTSPIESDVGNSFSLTDHLKLLLTRAAA